MGFLEAPVNMALNTARKKMINPKLMDIGTVEELTFRNKALYARIKLEGLEDHPLEVECSDIHISPDGKEITIGKFRANKKFAQTILDNMAAGKTFKLPDNIPKMVIIAAKKALGL